MHKFFAKTSFLGKNIIYLPHCHSTNDLLQQYVKSGHAKEGTIVIADFQTAGRGQRGNSWESESGENLLFSFCVKPDFLDSRKQYFLNVVTAVSMAETIEYFANDGLVVEVKWPNDLYINDRKCAGILLETQLTGKRLENAVIGIGLNLNQEEFADLNATSLRIEGLEVDRWELLEQFCLLFEQLYHLLQEEGEEELRQRYLSRLRWLHEPHEFQLTKSGRAVNGTIAGIDEIGRLRLQYDGTEQIFDIQQIKFIA